MADATDDARAQYVTGRRSALAAKDPAELYAGAIIDSVEGVMACLEGLSREELNWRPPVRAGNSLAILAAHVLGNVEEKVVATVGGETIDRSRVQEFLSDGADATVVAARWIGVRQRIPAILKQLPAAAWELECQTGAFPQLTKRAILLLAHRHSSEHLGEAQLIRDLVHARRE